MQSDVIVETENQRIAMYLEAIDAKYEDQEHGDKAAAFVQDNLLVDGSPISYRVAANYLEMVLHKGFPEEKLKKCRCVTGWVEKEDGSVYPCDRCRPEQAETWWATEVDEDRMPT